MDPAPSVVLISVKTRGIGISIMITPAAQIYTAVDLDNVNEDAVNASGGFSAGLATSDLVCSVRIRSSSALLLST